MNKLIQIINEEISAIRKDKKQEIFDYHSIADQAWDKKNKQAQEFQRINFDLENDDSTGQKKTATESRYHRVGRTAKPD